MNACWYSSPSPPPARWLCDSGSLVVNGPLSLKRVPGGGPNWQANPICPLVASTGLLSAGPTPPFSGSLFGHAQINAGSLHPPHLCPFCLFFYAALRMWCSQILQGGIWKGWGAGQGCPCYFFIVIFCYVVDYFSHTT